jgi:1-acyl-sn-glycerol-3-phosphate acyltransferase
MLLIRSLLYFGLMVLSTFFFALLIAVFGWFLPASASSLMAGWWGAINLWFLKWICGLDYQVQGSENIPDTNALILCKHQSSWETIALRWLLPFNQSWVLKKELMRIPVFGWALSVVKPIAIDRQSGRKAVKQVVKEGIEHLRKGQFVIIFPEGTRVAPGERKKYGIGGALLAAKSGYPVLPIAHNAGVFWARRGLIKYPGTVQLVIGPLIETKGLDTAEINRRTEEWIETTMEKLPDRISV